MRNEQQQRVQKRLIGCTLAAVVFATIALSQQAIRSNGILTEVAGTHGTGSSEPAGRPAREPVLAQERR
jgi:hypothetical protein